MTAESATPGIMEAIAAAAGIKGPGRDMDALRKGLRALVRLAGIEALAECSPTLPDCLTAWVDGKLSDQLNEILHHPEFLALEATWRGLRFLVDRIDFSQNVKLAFLSISKADLLRDFQDVPEVVQSGFYKHIYTAEFGQFGGEPVGAILADYTFGAGHEDIQLLQYVSSVASMAHAPFFAAAGKEFFGLDSWSRLPDIRDLKSLFDMRRYDRWNSFRDSENARYIGLCLPGFLLRLPYTRRNSPSVAPFDFVEEHWDEDWYCWGNTALAMGVCLAGSFALYRWCVNIVGIDGGGVVPDIPCDRYDAMGDVQRKIPTRVLITEHQEFALAELGFISLVPDRDSGKAVFLSANSALRPRRIPATQDGLATELGYMLSCRFPYMMLMNRLAHYIKVLQRESVGSWRDRESVSRELNRWLGRYVTEMDTPDAQTRSRRPLRMARIEVKDVDANPGCYSITLLARPHFTYMGVNFTLSLEGRLDRQPQVG